MNVSAFDLFKLGVGPSSSHTMGPMSAAARFLESLREAGVLGRVARVETTLYASLALTGRGHATDLAVIWGLAGFEPHAMDPDAAEAALADIRAKGRLRLGGEHEIAFDEATDILWEGRTRLDPHPNALRFAALDANGRRWRGARTSPSAAASCATRTRWAERRPRPTARRSPTTSPPARPCWRRRKARA